MMKHLIAITLISAMLFFGCTGENQSSISASGQSPPAQQTTQPTNGSVTLPNPPSTPNAPSAGDVKGRLQNYLNLWRAGPWKATYTTAPSDPNAPSNAVHSLYYMNENNWNYDLGAMKLYAKNGANYTCTNATTGGNWRCGMLSYVPPLLPNDQPNPLPDGVYTRLENRNIAGANAECFSISPKEMPGLAYEWCFSKEGVILFNGRLENGKMFQSVQAISFDTSVNDNEIALPAIPTD